MVFLIIFLSSITVFARDAVVFGDSMTRAVLADTNMSIINKKTRKSYDFETKDNVNDFTGLIADRPWFSWFDGIFGYSIKHQLGYDKTWNRAVSGAETHNVLSMFNKFVAEMEPIDIRSKEIDAWVAIGPNDICNTNIKTPKMSADQLIQTLSLMIEQSRWFFYVTDLVDLTELRKFNDDRSGFFGMTCKKLKEHIPACRRFVLGLSEEEQNQRMKDYWEEWRRVESFIESTGRGKFIRIFEGMKLQREWMASDCFHPNYKGEWVISNLIMDFLKR